MQLAGNALIEIIHSRVRTIAEIVGIGNPGRDQRCIHIICHVPLSAVAACSVLVS